MSLEKKLLIWLLTGETGISSKAIASVMAGVRVDDTFGTTPSDPDDFKRCLKLVNLIPEIRPRLSEMRTVSFRWGVLIENWDKLESSFMAEVPEWLENKGHEKRATKTYALMKAIGL